MNKELDVEEKGVEMVLKRISPGSCACDQSVIPKCGFHILSRKIEDMSFSMVQSISVIKTATGFAGEFRFSVSLCFPRGMSCSKWEDDVLYTGVNSGGKWTFLKYLFLIRDGFFLHSACCLLTEFELFTYKMEHLDCIAGELPSIWSNVVQRQREWCHAECFRNHCVPHFWQKCEKAYSGAAQNHLDFQDYLNLWLSIAHFADFN